MTDNITLTLPSSTTKSKKRRLSNNTPNNKQVQYTRGPTPKLVGWIGFHSADGTDAFVDTGNNEVIEINVSRIPSCPKNEYHNRIFRPPVKTLAVKTYPVDISHNEVVKSTYVNKELRQKPPSIRSYPTPLVSSSLSSQSQRIGKTNLISPALTSSNSPVLISPIAPRRSSLSVQQAIRSPIKIERPPFPPSPPTYQMINVTPPSSINTRGSNYDMYTRGYDDCKEEYENKRKKSKKHGEKSKRHSAKYSEGSHHDPVDPFYELSASKKCGLRNRKYSGSITITHGIHHNPIPKKMN